MFFAQKGNSLQKGNFSCDAGQTLHLCGRSASPTPQQFDRTVSINQSSNPSCGIFQSPPILWRGKTTWFSLLAFAPVCGNITKMKSAYELAMERLQANSPSVPLTDEQRAKIAELDSVYQAKIAEKEIFLKGQIAKAMEQGDFEALTSLEKQLSVDRAALQSELEEKKEKIRSATP